MILNPLTCCKFDSNFTMVILSLQAGGDEEYRKVKENKLKKNALKKKKQKTSCSLSKRIHKEKDQQTFRENEKTNKKEKRKSKQKNTFSRVDSCQSLPGMNKVKNEVSIKQIPSGNVLTVICKRYIVTHS